tara:strand:+ start:65 stop:649 length:585 start_codon:yes stop_codon:yes gene_type:complete
MRISQELRRIADKVKPTKTLDFLFPLTGYDKVDLNPYLVNAYLGDIAMLDWDLESPDVFVLMRFYGNRHFMRLEKMLENDKYFKTSYELYQGKYIMFVFTISPSFLVDYKRFIEGKYSQFSDPAKIRIMRHRTKDSPMPLILDKDNSLKIYWENRLNVKLSSDDEVWPILNKNDEYFDRNKFKKLMNIVDIIGM